MLFNVSTLLGESVGATRRHPLDATLGGRAARGEVQLMRTGPGILVSAQLTLDEEFECARCLARVRRPIELSFDEEYLPQRDPVTGMPPADPDPDAFRIDTRLHLDLSEAIRQYEQAALPISPLCREDCAGLCPTCGADRNEGPCGCSTDDPDSRWAALAALAGELRHEEDRRGAPQA